MSLLLRQDGGGLDLVDGLLVDEVETFDFQTIDNYRITFNAERITGGIADATFERMKMTETDKACCQGVPPIPGRTPAEAFRLIFSAQAGSADACFELSRCFEVGEGVPEDPVKACAWMLLAAERGVKEARAGYTRLMARLSPEEAVEAADAALDYGTPESADDDVLDEECYGILASLLEPQTGKKLTAEEIDDLLERSEAGDAEARGLLNSLLPEEDAGYGQTASAAWWLLKDAGRDAEGFLTPEAVDELTLAAGKGDVPACFALSLVYLAGEHDPCPAGKSSLAQHLMDLYSNGLDDDEDFPPGVRSVAFAWLSVAAYRGDVESLEELEKLKRRLSFKELEDGELLAEEYTAKLAGSV